MRDPRKDATTGWVFGTFIYDGSAEGATPFDRMQPGGPDVGRHLVKGIS